MSSYFKYYTKQELQTTTRKRRFETKLGERVQVLDNADNLEESLKVSRAKFVVLGIKESIGVKGNYGNVDQEDIWAAFLESFVNLQSNDFVEGGEVLILGHFDFAEVESLIESNAHDDEERVSAYRHAVNQVDDAVEPLIKLITQYNKIPVVISGGHNNAYPIIKGAAKGLSKAGKTPLASINCVNLDVHPEFRAMEGRHSGNPFTYAEEDGYLQKYCIIGIHENQLTQNIWMDVVNNPFIDFITYEDIFIHEKKSFLEAIAHATTFTEDNYTGIELDFDIIENHFSSLSFAGGISPLHARQFVSYASGDSKTAYLHICASHKAGEKRSSDATGKLISYLVSDFLKAKE